MIGESDESTLYDVLRVAESATSDEIRAAYFSLVRRLPPRRFPEEFRQISAAYETLGDPYRRAEYDQRRVAGRRVQVLVDQAAIACEKDPQKAMMLLKSAVTQAPDMARPRALLAHVLMRVEEYAVAERQYRWLLKHFPRDEALHYRLARCLYQQERLDEATAALNQALRFNPGYHDALTLLSQIQEKRRQTDALAETLERAIQNDGRVNFADFDALLKLYVLYLQEGNEEHIAPAAERLLGVIGPSQATQGIQRLARAAAGQMEVERFDIARALLYLAARIPLASEEDAEQAQALQQAIRRVDLVAEARTATRDSLISGGLNACLTVIYLDSAKDSIREYRMQAALEAIKREASVEPRELIRRIDYLRAEYRLLGQEQAAFLSHLRERAERSAAAAPPPRETPAPETPARRGNLLERLFGGT